MTVEYIVLGVILILMGVVQVWLRHGPGPRERGDAASPGEARLGGESSGHGRSDDAHQGELRRRGESSAGRIRSGRAWEAWTAILGGVGILVGIALVIAGALGR